MNKHQIDYDFHIQNIDKILWAYDNEVDMVHILFGFYCASFFERLRGNNSIPFIFDNIEVIQKVNEVYFNSPTDQNADYPYIYEETLLFVKDKLVEEKENVEHTR